MSFSQALQPRVNYRKWDAFKALGLGKRGYSTLQGVCTNKLGNRCGWVIEGEPYERFRAKLEQMEAEHPSRAPEFLPLLAEFAVCPHHTRQAQNIRSDWETLLGITTDEYESLETQLEKEKEEKEAAAAKLKDLELRLKNTPRSSGSNAPAMPVFQFGAGTRGGPQENSTDKRMESLKRDLKLAEEEKQTLIKEKDLLIQEKADAANLSQSILVTNAKSLENERKDMEKERNEFENTLKAFKEECKSLKSEKHRALEEAVSLRSKSEEDLETLRQEMNSKLSLEEKTMATLQKKLDDSEERLSRSKEQVSSLQAQLDRAEKVRKGFVQEIERFQKEVQAQKDQISSQEGQVATLQAELVRHQRILRQTPTVSKNTKSKKPSLSKTADTFRKPPEVNNVESMKKKDRNGFWARLFDRAPLGKKGK